MAEGPPADVLTPEMLRTMATNPIVMALANPDPEIAYDKAVVSRPDIIFATGRSDYPNQVNNVLGFPYIFRGALDVRATKINEEMKLAAAHALGLSVVISSSIESSLGLTQLARVAAWLTPQTLPGLDTLALMRAQLIRPWPDSPLPCLSRDELEPLL